MTRQVSAWQRGHPLSWAQRSWGPSIVLSTHSLSSSSLSLSSSLYLNPLRNHRLPPSRSYPRCQSLSLVLLLPISVPPLLPSPSPSPLSSLNSLLLAPSSVRRSIGILHPVPPLTRWRRTKVLTLMFHSRCCLLPTIRTHVYAARCSGVSTTDENFVRKMRST